MPKRSGSARPFEIRIENLAGRSPLLNFASKGQYISSIGIDPDFPISDTDKLPSGFLRPTSMADFSGVNVNATPLWLSTNPKNELVYAYLANGKLVSYSSALASETLRTTVTTSSGNGMAYYDNYLYLAKNADIARYGRLDGSPTVTQAYWTSSLSLTALTNTTYPSIDPSGANVEMPNHVMHRHTDDKLYICDVHANGYGIISYIKTKKTTNQGDTDDGSTYNALDFDYGLYPTTIATYQTNLAVAVIEGVSTSVRQKNAKMSFWDTTSDSFSLITDDELPDPLITAVLNVNGVLWVASGSAKGGCRISKYVGGYHSQQVFYDPHMLPPLQGAFAHLLNRVVFGSAVDYPANYGLVTAIGSSSIGGQPVHGILKASSAGANSYITCLAYVQNDSLEKLAPIVGWTDDTTAGGIDKLSTTYGTSIFRSEMYRIGEPFRIEEIIIPSSTVMASNITITPKVYVDDGSSSVTLKVINNTNFASRRIIKLASKKVIGQHNFFLELTWSGSALCTLALPIIIRGYYTSSTYGG